MLDRLPLELVQRIVQLSLPANTSPFTYEERQDTLLALCETTKTLSSIAQPLLYEVVALEQSISSDRKKQSASARTRIEHRVFQQQSIELNALGLHKALRNLVLSHVSLDLEESRPITLPALEDLSTVCSTFPASFLTTAICLSLRKLHLQLTEKNSLEKWDVATALPDLQLFSCDSYDLQSSLTFKPIQSTLPSLIDFANFYGYGLDFQSVRILAECRHVRYNPNAWHGTIDSERCAEVFALVDDVVELVYRIKEGAVPHLSTLILPSTLRHNHTHCDDMDLLQNLLDACESHNVEVIFEDSPHPYHDSFISPAFSRRCRVLRQAGHEKSE
ncbi:hypothetical protein JCM11641_001032 [Rhodosporidiobolus odoratus]